MLYKETVSAETWEMIQVLMKDEMLKKFYLVGGTSLALRFGHRKSIDIDLFTIDKFDRQALESHLREKLDPDWLVQKSHGMSITKGRENIDLWYYPAPLARNTQITEGVRMLSIEDVAAMKVNNIAFGSDRPKDYIDLYYVLERKSLSEITQAYRMKYPDLSANDHVRTLASIHRVAEKKLEVFDKKLNWRKIEKRFKEAILFPAKVFKSGLRQNKRRDI